MGQEPGVTEVQFISPPPPPGGRRGDGNVIQSLLNFKRKGGSCGNPMLDTMPHEKVELY